jgi:hypothetical protein
VLPSGHDLAEVCQAVSYFAVALFAIRWWRLTDRRRAHRFSFAPLLAAGCWGGLLLMVWPQMRGVLALLLASAIVQLVSPWDQPPAPTAKRLRLRYA